MQLMMAPNKRKGAKMAKIEKILPFLIKWESKVDMKKYGHLPVEQLFNKAKETGYTDDPADPGGATMIGVTFGTFREYRRRTKKVRPTVEDLNVITFDEWSSIVRMFFWNRWKGDQIRSQKVANMLVDWVWTSGVLGVKKPQNVLGTAADGLVGPKTLESVNKADPDCLFRSLKAARIDYIDNIVFSSIISYERRIGRKATDKELIKYTKRRFKDGWIARINDLENL